MPRIRTLSDADAAIQRLENEISLLKRLNLDLSGRRVINAGRSQHSNDYVIREELDDLDLTQSEITASSIIPASIVRGRQIDLIIHDIIAIQTNATPQISLAVDTLIVEMELTVDLAPIGADIVYQVKTDANVFATATIPAGMLTSGIVTADLGTISARTQILSDVLSVGTDFPGSRLVCSLRSA